MPASAWAGFAFFKGQSKNPISLELSLAHVPTNFDVGVSCRQKIGHLIWFQDAAKEFRTTLLHKSWRFKARGLRLPWFMAGVYFHEPGQGRIITVSEICFAQSG